MFCAMEAQGGRFAILRSWKDTRFAGDRFGWKSNLSVPRSRFGTVRSVGRSCGLGVVVRKFWTLPGRDTTPMSSMHQDLLDPSIIGNSRSPRCIARSPFLAVGTAGPRPRSFRFCVSVITTRGAAWALLAERAQKGRIASSGSRTRVRQAARDPGHHWGHHDLPGLTRSRLFLMRSTGSSKGRVPRGICPSGGGFGWRVRTDSNRRPPDSKLSGNRRECPSGAVFRLASLPGTTGSTTTGVDLIRRPQTEPDGAAGEERCSILDISHGKITAECLLANLAATHPHREGVPIGPGTGLVVRGVENSGPP